MKYIGVGIKIKMGVLTKNFNVATCEHCKKQTNIQKSKAFQQMIVQNKSLKEEVRESNIRAHGIRVGKNGIIQSMHRRFKDIFDLLTEEQKKKAVEISQEMNDEIKSMERGNNGKSKERKRV